MTLGILEQADWSGGVWRVGDPQLTPPNSAYDIMNGLVDDVGAVYRRGGTDYASNTDEADLAGVAVSDFASGRQTVFWSQAGADFWRLSGFAGTTPSNLTGLVQRPAFLARPAFLLDLLVFPSYTGTELMFYGGSSSTAAYGTGTVSVTAGSRTVTGAGTAWLANIDAGTMLHVGAQRRLVVVESVQSDTSLTLRDGWQGVTASGSTYSLDHIRSLAPVGVPLAGRQYVTTVGTIPRLIIAQGSTVYFSDAGDPFEFRSGTNNYSIGRGLTIRGVTSLRDTVFVFTNDGIFTISNMNYDAVDDFGNVNHVVSQINKDLVLWGDAGWAGYHGGLIVPALDDVYLVAPDGSLRGLAENIKPLYRSYVTAGYVPGLAVTYRGHYLLPVLDGTTVVDMLVLKLDTGAWTRWDGHAACKGFATQASTEAQKVVGFDDSRLIDVAPCFGTGNTADANGTAHQLAVTTRDFMRRRQSRTLWKFARLSYETDVTLRSQKATGPAGSSFTELDGSADADDGTDPFEWLVDERSQAVRLRFLSDGAAAGVRLRSLEVHYRDGAKR